MNENNGINENSILRDFTSGFGIAKIAGIILIVVAVCFGGWLILLIERLFNEPSSIALLNQLAESSFELTFLMNEQVFKFVAPDLLIYGVPIILLLVIIRMIMAFVTMGSQLLNVRSR